tara:strand:- start:159 stop:419 length:261 start_codon:yes stop_codon:yes gene_type:complete
MAQVFNSIDAKKNYDNVLEELEQHFTNFYETREDEERCEFCEFEPNTLRNFTRNEYYNALNEGFIEFGLPYWLLDWLFDVRFKYSA